MVLQELAPQWVYGKGNDIVGVCFNCPTTKKKSRVVIIFDRGYAIENGLDCYAMTEGGGFHNITISPAITCHDGEEFFIARVENGFVYWNENGGHKIVGY